MPINFLRQPKLSHHDPYHHQKYTFNPRDDDGDHLFALLSVRDGCPAYDLHRYRFNDCDKKTIEMRGAVDHSKMDALYLLKRKHEYSVSACRADATLSVSVTTIGG